MGGEFWDFSGVPVIEGWYAVVVCYDSYEGMFPAAAYWDGGVWSDRAVVGFGVRCENEGDASRVAYEHDFDT